MANATADMPAWTLAAWREDGREEEGVIPTNWLEYGFVRWPQVTNVERYMNEGKLPGSTWSKFPLIKVKFTSSRKEECEAYNDTTSVEDSDVEEDESQIKKRNRVKKVMPDDFVADIGEWKKNQRAKESVRSVSGSQMSELAEEDLLENVELESSEHSQIQESQDTQDPVGQVLRPLLGLPKIQTKSKPKTIRTPHSVNSLPQPPVTPFRPREDKSNNKNGKRKRDVSSDYDSDDSFLYRSHTRHRSRSIKRHRSPSNNRRSRSNNRRSRSNNRRSHSNNRRSSSNDRRSRSKKRRRSRSRSCRGSPVTGTSGLTFPMSEKRFQRKVLLLLSQLKDGLTQTRPNSMDTLPSSSSSRHPPLRIQPCTTVEEFEELNHSLQDDDETLAQLKVTLARIGGVTAEDNVKRVVDKLIAVCLQAKMNLSGRYGKFGVKDTLIYQTIKVVLLELWNTLTESQLEDIVQRHLKYAPGRSGGGGRKHRGNDDEN